MAAKKKSFSAQIDQELADAYYDGMRQEKAKVIPLADAIEVTDRQRAEDEAAGFAPYLDKAESESESETPSEA